MRQATDDLAFTRLAEALRDFYIRSQSVLEKLLAEEGISYAKMRVIYFIGLNEGARSVDLMKAFGHAPRTVTEAVDALERDGLVERVPDPRDRRAKKILLTAAGQQMFEAAEPIRRRLGTEIFGVLDAKEQKALQEMLKRMSERLAALE